MKVKPFLRWAGGKQKIVSNLLENAPDHDIINNYFEPFLGAGSLFFSNGFNRGFISDINPELINSYYQIKINHKSVYKNLVFFSKKFREDKQFYYQVRKDFNTQIGKKTIIQASRFIFLIHTNYNGMYRLNKKGHYNVPIGKLNPSIPGIKHLEIVSQKLKNIEIECSGYDSIMSMVKPNDFIYLDPPYPPYDWSNQQNQYTLNKFSREDHEDLFDFATQLDKAGCYVMISYPNIEFVKDKYEKNWNIEKLDIFRSISCKKERRKISELIIKNY
ncbi:Dam family site-specific DNA-(adenine-N6)-methyltransferase [uncultured Tenacibaculum sp.]|uniref:DNA adenine methylase n=1 Tax=uncultured Tenacibaculum sp. TaxID=174713 RepID=UPI002638C594|nr:Dam family site-specific DNA-(adenine-N6)-methyltransferase [uncultured Tenacibaculum sp.]